MLTQTVLLVVSISILAWSLVATTFVAVPLTIVAIVVLQLAALIRYVESHVRSLEDFFAAVRYEDFARRYVEDDIDVELKTAFNRILEKFQGTRADRDAQAVYLETVVKHVPVPFIAAKSDGALSLVNNPARRLTGLNSLHHLDQLAEFDSQLPMQLRSIAAGDQRLVKTRFRNLPVELRVSVSEIRFGGEHERLYSIEDLSRELKARETTAWRDLIRVLTHEVMNTLTPVTSLAQTSVAMLEDIDTADDIKEAMATIARRSEGLTDFISRYRELLKVPTPKFEPIKVLEALNGIVALMSVELSGIIVSVTVVPSSLTVSADRQLLDQMLINIVRNAIDALSDSTNPELHLLTDMDFGRTVVRIRDTGTGIDADDLGQIFVPFFTTKREGSGIGLSLCRQIMTAHQGEIVVESDETGTSVSLIF